MEENPIPLGADPVWQPAAFLQGSLGWAALVAEWRESSNTSKILPLSENSWGPLAGVALTAR